MSNASATQTRRLTRFVRQALRVSDLERTTTRMILDTAVVDGVIASHERKHARKVVKCELNSLHTECVTRAALCVNTGGAVTVRLSLVAVHPWHVVRS